MVVATPEQQSPSDVDAHSNASASQSPISGKRRRSAHGKNLREDLGFDNQDSGSSYNDSADGVDDVPNSSSQTQEGDIVDSVKPKPKRRGRLTEAEKEARDESKIPGRKIDLQATIKAKNKKIREAREELDKYKGKLRACRLENEENKKRLNVSESSLTRMRDEIFTQVEQAKPYFETDEQVAQAFTRVFEAVNNWTKKHAIPCEKTDQKGFETTISILCNDDRYPDFMSKKMKEAVKLGTVYPYVTTAAAINRIFAEEVFDNPFTFLSQRPHGDLELDMIVWLMSVALMKGSELECRKARSFLMKFFTKTTEESVGNSAEKHFEEMAGLKEQKSQTISQILVTKLSVLLTPVDVEAQTTRVRALTRIVSAAIDLSCRLAIQQSNVTLKFLDQMKQHRYKVYHENLECHRACKLDELDSKSKKALYKKPLDMVIQPMVCRTGNVDGVSSEIGDERVLVKAVVWMVKNENARPDGDEAITSPRKKMKRSDDCN